MGEDLRLDRAELRAGVDAQLVAEQFAGALVGLQCVRLTARSIQGDHQSGPQALAIGMLDDERLELGHELRSPAVGELGLDRRIQGPVPQGLESPALGVRERHAEEVAVGGPPPQGERLPKDPRRVARRVPVRRRLGDEVLEHPRVEVGASQRKPVATVHRLDGMSGLATQDVTEPCDMAVEGPHRGGGRGVAPDVVDEDVRCDGMGRVRDQRRHQPTLHRTTECEGPPARGHAQRTEDPEVHTR